jgi:cobalt-zinc-cadmium efflux system outer membrane protein
MGRTGAGRAAGGTLAALALLFIADGPARSDETPSRKLTFQAARAAAEEAAPDVTLASRRGEVVRAGIGVVSALANPILTFTTARQTAAFGAGIGVPLPLFGQRSTAVEAAHSDAEAARLEVEAARAEARFGGSVAWLDLWEAQAASRLLAEAARDSARVAAIAAEKLNAGTAPRVDVLRTAADAARTRADAELAAANIPAAAARLAMAMGSTDELAWAADGKAALSLGEADLMTLQHGLVDHPTLRRDQAQVMAAMAHVRAEQRLRWPTLVAQLTVNFRDPTLPGTDVIGGLSFEPPVLNLRGGAIARARAEQRLAESTTAVDVFRLKAALVDAFGRASGAETRARVLATEVLPSLDEVRRMTEEGYRDGRVDLLRLLDAQRAWLDSRLAQVQAEASWQRALAEIERAAGIDLERGPGGAR